MLTRPSSPSSEQKVARKKKKERKGKRSPRKLWLAIGAAAIVLLMIYAAVFHRVRGRLIKGPFLPSEYAGAVRRLSQVSMTIRSQRNMDDLGIVAHQAVTEAGLVPGSFRVMYLPRLDVREKLHHLFHGPFTGLENIYADIWINSCTVYGHAEPTWGTGKCMVGPADKLSILIILIDRLKRGRSAPGEHICAYGEVFAGMRLHTLPGRASCYAILIRQCAKDRALAELARRHLRRRTQSTFDKTETAFWSYMANQPTREVLENLAASETPPAAPEREDASHVAVFDALLKSYGSRR